MGLILIVTIAGRKVALEASRVESVIELDTLSPVPRAPDHVAGLSALRSRVMTVIDAKRALGLGTTTFTPGEIHEAAVCESDGHFYAVSVDNVEDVIEAHSEPQEVRADMGKGWERVGLGLVESEVGPLLLLDVDKLITGDTRKDQAA